MLPFHNTVAPDAKPVPVTVSVNAGPPAVADDGDKLVKVRPCVMTSCRAGGGVCPARTETSIATVAADEMRAAGTAAVSCVAETKVVASGFPFHVTVVALLNPVPFNVSVNAGPPAATVEGETLVSVNDCPFDIVKGSDAGCGCPVTLTAAVPAATSNVAGTSAVSCVVDTKLVANGEPFQVTDVPLAKPANYNVHLRLDRAYIPHARWCRNQSDFAVKGAR